MPKLSLKSQKSDSRLPYKDEYVFGLAFFPLFGYFQRKWGKASQAERT